MSTFTALVAALHRECGAAGTAPAVTATAGQDLRLVKWIVEADYIIQTMWTDWRFLWAQASVPTIGSQATLDSSDPSFPADLNYWDYATFMIDGDPLEVVEYFEIRGEVLDTNEGQPGRVIVMPDNSLKFEPVPDTVYTITADYYSTPVKLSSGSDTSAIPVEFENAIIGRALILYANYENAEEAKIQGMEMYEEGKARLENSQLPNKQHSRYKQGARIEVIAE